MGEMKFFIGLVSGCWFLVAGFWLLASGVDICSKFRQILNAIVL